MSEYGSGIGNLWNTEISWCRLLAKPQHRCDQTWTQQNLPLAVAKTLASTGLPEATLKKTRLLGRENLPFLWPAHGKTKAPMELRHKMGKQHKFHWKHNTTENQWTSKWQRRQVQIPTRPDDYHFIIYQPIFFPVANPPATANQCPQVTIHGFGSSDAEAPRYISLCQKWSTSVWLHTYR